MPWSNQNGGGPWGGGKNQGPWGQGPNRQRGGGGNTPPDLDEIIRRSQDRLKNVLPGGFNSGIALLILVLAAGFWLMQAVYTVQPRPAPPAGSGRRLDPWPRHGSAASAGTTTFGNPARRIRTSRSVSDATRSATQWARARV